MRGGGRFTYSALLCGSWNCASCRRARSAAELDRLRRGLELHSDGSRVLVTLTIDPSRFGAVQTGTRSWDANGHELAAGSPAAVRTSRTWSEPTPRQFSEACVAMSKEWNRLTARLRMKAKRAGLDPHEFYRVVELHRNGWPHYHVVLLHSTWGARDIRAQLEGWSLGSITDARDVSIDDAVGELAPYLVSKERGKGHKGYQFAAHALPTGFRLIQPSRGWLPSTHEPSPDVEHAQILHGHFTWHHQAQRSWGADVRIVLPQPAPPDRPHRPPGTSVATGDAARLYYTAQLEAQHVQLTPEQAALAARALHEQEAT